MESHGVERVQPTSNERSDSKQRKASDQVKETALINAEHNEWEVKSKSDIIEEIEMEEEPNKKENTVNPLYLAFPYI